MKQLVKSVNYIQNVGEINDQPSETIPDQAIDVGKLYDIFVRTGRVPLMDSGLEPYFDEDNILDFEGLDLVELAELKENLQYDISVAKQSLSEYEREYKEALEEEQRRMQTSASESEQSGSPLL